MREIKFRAWDKKNKKWAEKFVCLSIADNRILERVSNLYPIEIELTYNFELSQFTGLKDKNGVEIYEGDIIKRTSIKENRDGSITLGLKNNKKTSLKVISFDTGKIWQGYQLDEDDEVIGNIYENPELLK